MVGGGERTHLWDQVDPSLIGCVILGKSLHLSEHMIKG